MENNNTKRIKKLVAVAMFSALAFVTTVLCGYFPKIAGFLSLEFKDAVIVICSLIYGPVSGLAIAILVPVLESFTVSVTGWYGLIMNILSSVTFVLVSGLIYKYKRSFFGAVAGLAAGVFSVTAVMLIANLLITPLYLTYVVGAPSSMGDVARMLPTILLPFNFIKATLNAAIVLLLYKPLSNALKKTGFVEVSNVGEKTKNTKRSLAVSLISIAVILLSFVIMFVVLK